MEIRVSRRTFLVMSAGATATALAACAPAAPAPTPAAQPAPAEEQPTAAEQAPAAEEPTEAPQPTEAAQPAASGEKVNLQFMWWPVGGERGLKAMDAALKPFEDANPNITVERIPVAQNYPDKLLTMFAGGTPPDVCAIDNYNISQFADKGVLQDLGPVIEADQSFLLDAFFDAALKEGIWQGKRFALPYIGSTRIMFYNIDLMEEKNLETPDKLWEAGQWTWDKFLEYATALTDASGGAANTVYGCYDDLLFEAGGISAWIWGAKGSILNEDHTKCLLAEAGAVAGIKYIQDLIHKYQVSPKAEARKDVDLVATGRIGMWFSWRGLTVGYRAFSYKWDVVPFPSGPAGKTTLYKGNSMSIAKDTKHPAEAWLLAKGVTGKEADAAFVANGGATPRKDNRDVLMKSTPPQNNQYFYDPLNEGWAKTLPLNPKWPVWATESHSYLDRIFLDNEDVEKVMTEFAPIVEGILAE